MGTEVPFCKVKRVLETGGGDGCTTVKYLTQPNCTLKNGHDGKFMLCVFHHNFFFKFTAQESCSSSEVWSPTCQISTHHPECSG